MASSEFYNDHHSPILSNEHSAASSPYMIKPPATTTFAHRQRSSSMNSITSNHSVLNAHLPHVPSNVPTPNNARSMSIVSIESPRNLIISMDDTSRPLRNDPGVGLAAFGPALPATGCLAGGMPCGVSSDVAHHPRENVVLRVASPPTDYSNRLKLYNSALFSDDDSELELVTPTRNIAKPVYKLKKYAPPTTDALDHLEQIKSDFRFKYKDHINSDITSPPSVPTTNAPNHPFKHLQDPTPSPLSLNNQDKELSLDLQSSREKSESSKLTKKVKPSTSMQKMYLKKFYSKELQFELLHNSNISPPVSPTISYSDSFIPDLHNKFAVPHLNSHLPKKTESISDQNKAITKLNQKWNKSMYSEVLEKKKDENDAEQKSKLPDSKKEDISRKRSRDWAEDEDDTFDERDDF
ncbi:uncharacterized protein CANTADRAFT_23178 [Suhomyces tanzawaensis NRRL Y-17324]|uniref:Uncharacterized protein n=1 Tax=Suhomyces tanzawaensis NRRL Y-17324 TaxID=984487 RepID=A0A1E4SEX4_9ASCO|nr:uncharacterized protein CANTADRAFT_23178 [Suhomyces tanzawaensis NRRL Y-17324]ODV78071.1 hypothetical protein CANTADRAFT_23178 [Suhomyces tanzawaensis NRRL Y-17324]